MRYIVKASQGGGRMRGIAKLLFGDDADRVLDLFGDDADGFGLAEQARRAGEWCGSVPGGDAGARRGAAHPRARRETVLRDFDR
jgi:hypothetical protein